MGLPGRSLHLLALPPLLPPVKGDHPRCRVLLPGGHHPGLHLPRPGGGPHHQQQHQPAQLPDRQPEAAAGVAARARGAGCRLECWGRRNNTTKCLPPPGHSCAPNRFWPFKLQHSWWAAAAAASRLVAAAAALGRNMPCSSKLCCSSAALCIQQQSPPQQHCPGSDNASACQCRAYFWTQQHRALCSEV